ncbi:MAG: hypothetical protein ACO3NK_16220 [Prochlorotrichaceae cyanobacterium]|jgi:hypothetical protein
MYQDYVGHNELIEPSMAQLSQYDYYLPTVPGSYWDKLIQESDRKKAEGVNRGSGR